MTMELYKSKSIKDLEDEVGRVYVGSVELDNTLKVRADMYTQPSGWILHVNIKYSLNGVERALNHKADMNDVDNGYRLNDLIQSLVLEDLSKFVTSESIKQNKRAIRAARREFIG